MKLKKLLLLLTLILTFALVGCGGDSDDDDDRDDRVEDEDDDEDRDKDKDKDEDEEDRDKDKDKDEEDRDKDDEEDEDDDKPSLGGMSIGGDDDSKGGSYRAQIEEVVLFDENDIKITATDISSDDYYLELNLLVENNSDLDILVSNDVSAVNGYAVYGSIYADVSAGKKVNDQVQFNISDLDTYKIKEISDISMDLSIMDDDSYDDIGYVELFTIETDFSGKVEDTFEYDGLEIYNEDGVKIIVGGLMEREYYDDIFLEFYIENNSGQNFTLDIEEFAVNDYMFDAWVYDDIPDTYGKVSYIQIYEDDLEDNRITEIETMDVNFSFFDRENYETIGETGDITIEFE